MQKSSMNARVRRSPAWIAPLWILVVLGCAGTPSGGPKGILSEAQALSLAVEIANQECQAKFSATPFDTASYPVRFADGRWWWGGLDLAGPGGMSASVSFDATGGDRRAEAYLSTDRVQGLYGTDSTRVRVERP